MSCNDLNSLDLDLGKRDDRRRMARHLGLGASFGEQLTGVTFDVDGQAMVVHAGINGSWTGSLAICSNPAGRRAPVFSGTSGMWHGPSGYTSGAPAVIGFDIESVDGGFFAGAASSLVCMDPENLVNPDSRVLIPAFLDSGLATDICTRHGKSSALLVLSAEGSQVHEDAFKMLSWSLARSGYYGPVIRAPKLNLKRFSRPEHPKRHRLASLIQVATALMLCEMERSVGFMPGESSRPRDRRAAA